MNPSTTSSEMEWSNATPCTAFDGAKQVATGTLAKVAAEAKALLDRRGERAALLIFDDVTGSQIEVDFRGSLRAVLGRLPKVESPPSSETSAEKESPPRGPGRPRLGVVAREVTLLPRHWEWLNTQPGGASVALRKLVEAARRTSAQADRKRQSQEAAYRFMTALAGDLEGYEEATRALFAGDAMSFHRQTATWPADVRSHAAKLAQAALVEAPTIDEPTVVSAKP